MLRDYGAGLTVDELVGMTAWQIASLTLPAGEVYRKVKLSAGVMLEHYLESFFLVELWEDGHSVWCDVKANKPVIITPSGQVLRNNP